MNFLELRQNETIGAGLQLVHFVLFVILVIP